MSSTIDPAKLKVADLRNELSARGLDVKGTKPILVKRLKDALEKELNEDLPDTSIADTSTEDLDTSKAEETSSPKKSLRSSVEEKEEAKPTRSAPSVAPTTPEKSKPAVQTPGIVDKPPQEKPSPKPDEKNTEIKPSPTKVSEVKSPEKPKTEAKSPVKIKTDKSSEGETEASADNVTPSEKTDESAEKVQLECENGEQTEHQDHSMDVQEEADKGAKTEESEKREKRKRSDDSPERPPKRARTPIKEDEPEINAETVALSWYDSDLNLQVDKNDFLSAKPLTEGAFGFIWAGARATHGISTGKVCYEVKITEKLKWEEFSRPDNRFRTDHRRSRYDDRKHSRNYDRRDDEKSRDRSERTRSESDKTKDDAEKPKEDAEKPEDDAEKPKDDAEQPENAVETEKSKDESEEKESTENKPEETPADKEKNTISETENSEENATKPDEPMETAETEEKKAENGDKKCDGDEEKSATEEKTEEIPPLPTHFFRIGWSIASASLQLGEDKNSYGYESTGQFVKNKELSDYGITFDAGDVVGAYLDSSETSVTIQFTVNGQVQPSIEIPKEELPEDFVLYPHILSRNYAFEVNFGEKEEPWFAAPSELSDYQFISKTENKVAGRTRPENRTDCEVILMCGLPASGKTHWVQEHIAANSEKNYNVLGNTSLLGRMTISGESLKSKYKGKWGIVIDRLQKCLNRLVSMASLRRRNYIIDQTNVFPSAQRRKLRPFEGFKRKAVIVVVGDEEQARRQTLQETLEGKEVPDSTLLEMKAAMTLPEPCDWLEEVNFVGVEEGEAKEIVTKFNAAGKAAGFGPENRPSRDRWSHRNYRNDYRGGKNYRDGGYNRYQPYQPRDRWGPPSRHGGGGGSRGGWKQDPRSRDWRGGGYDNRDRDYYNQGGYRNRNQQSSGGGSRGGQRWGSSGGGWGGQGGWNQQNFGRSYNQSWGGQNQGGWGGKYGSSGSGGGQGQNYGGYGGGWNYYGQQGQQQQQNWSGQE